MSTLHPADQAWIAWYAKTSGVTADHARGLLEKYHELHRSCETSTSRYCHRCGEFYDFDGPIHPCNMGSSFAT